MSTEKTFDTLVNQIADAIADRVVSRLQEDKKPEAKPTRGRGRPSKPKPEPKEDDDLSFDEGKTEVEDSEEVDEESVGKIKAGMQKLIKKYGKDFRTEIHKILEDMEWKVVGNGTLDEFLEHRGKTFAKRLKKLAANQED